MSSPIFDFTCTGINGDPIPLSRYRGNVMLIVNTASHCGFTPQYKGLEQIYREYRERGFVVLAFPSNQFKEEPLDNDKINDFCMMNYGVTFPMFAKVKVNGPDEEPLFAWLKKEKPGFLGAQRIAYNFSKFLVDREGRVVGRFAPLTFPQSLRQKINAIL